jgi:drug/metabolite transporter (DMT)-like permease
LYEVKIFKLAFEKHMPGLILMKQQGKAYLYAGTAVLMWSTVGSAFKLTLRYISPVQMLLISSFISILVMLSIAIIQGKWKLILASRSKDLRNSALFGFLNPLLFYVVLFNSYDILLTQEAMVLNFTWPVTLTILSMLILKQKIRTIDFVAIFICLIGIVVIGTDGRVMSLRFGNPLGVTLALSSTVIWAFFWIFNMKDTRDEVVKLLLNFIFGFIYILILTMLPVWKGENAWNTTPGIPGLIDILSLQSGFYNAILGCVYIGIFEMGVAYVLWMKGLQLSVTTARVSSLIFIAPFVSLIIINLAVGESIHLSTLAGLVFIVGGLVMQRLIK